MAKREPGDVPAEGELLPEQMEQVAMDITTVKITDHLDLHSFPPREIKGLVTDWLDLAYNEGHRELRIIHGKGIGVQRETVRKILQRDPRVVEFGDAKDASGWGATRVVME